jgi:predicted TIM-barrel fold metal-dependent hydrolase
MTTIREAWLALVTEEALVPDLPICDAHHHLWDRPSDRYLSRIALAGGPPLPPYTNYGLDDLLRDIGGGHNVTHTVFMECTSMYKQDGPEEMTSVGETEFMQNVAAEVARRWGKTDVAAGIVGFADLTLGDRVTPVLEAHIQAGKGRFRGIRHSCAWDASPDIGRYKNPPQGLMSDARFRQGIARLQEVGLSFDAWHFHTQFMELVGLARAFPALSIILDHIGGPLGTGPYAGRREEVF